ncbi:hypothetical protein GALL_117190 [mine drainage metagenome]|uniref:DUF4239 domain-containing protein n=1 Tax=mine drainage metagenome TaxID=410659 RepID=A0A1J5T233_9ZZZZ
MIPDFLYNHSNWLVGLTVAGSFVGFGLALLLLAHTLLPKDWRSRHNEFVGFMLAVVSVVYAVLLAFLAIAVWESFGKAGEIAAREASLAGDLAHDSMAMPEPLRGVVVAEVKGYLGWVIGEEWPAMGRGEALSGEDGPGAALADVGWARLFGIHQALAAFKAADSVQTAMFSEVLARLNSLYDARRDRLLQSEEHLQPVVWGVVLFGAAITIAFTTLFGMDSLLMHGLMTAAVAAIIALVVLLIVAFDYPYRGKVQITPDAYRHVLQVLVRAGER